MHQLVQFCAMGIKPDLSNFQDLRSRISYPSQYNIILLSHMGKERKAVVHSEQHYVLCYHSCSGKSLPKASAPYYLDLFSLSWNSLLLSSACPQISVLLTPAPKSVSQSPFLATLSKIALPLKLPSSISQLYLISYHLSSYNIQILYLNVLFIVSISHWTYLPVTPKVWKKCLVWKEL